MAMPQEYPGNLELIKQQEIGVIWATGPQVTLKRSSKLGFSAIFKG